ncbi:LytR C-terminal domain-containing protein, partial [Streptomyces monashensis]|uniref:LytR C-terminal domain-containing protein n=1 Tax=Streptomyces monashensis TaxID=1678012 RepID=UPI003F5419D7
MDDDHPALRQVTEKHLGHAQRYRHPATAATTTLTYGTGQKPEAQAVASALGLPTSHLKQGSGTGLTLVIGSDWPSGTSFPADNGS